MEQLRQDKPRIKLLHAPVVSDFGYQVMPSLFLSDTLSFLRLQAINQSGNLLLKINRKEIQAIHKEFMDILWDKEEELSSDSARLEQFVSEQLEGLRILADTVGDESRPEEPEPEMR